MGRHLYLESFDQTAPPSETAHPEYQRGDADGYARGIAESLTKDAAKLSELHDTLSATSFTYAEARHQVIAEIKPVIDAVIATLVPEIAQLKLASTLREHLLNAVTQTVDAGPKLTLHPQTFAQFQQHETLADIAGLTVTKSDRDHPLVAWVSGENSEHCFDFSDALQVVENALNSLTEQPKDTAHHG